jgi:endoglucanase
MNTNPLRRRPVPGAVVALLKAGLAALLTAGLAVLVAPTPAAAATALPAPGTPVASDVTTTSLTLTWTPSAGPVASYTVQVIDEPRGLFHTVGTPTGPTFHHTGLRPDTVHIYRIIAQPVPDSGYTASPQSGLVYVTTRPLPDSQPPTQPGRPHALSISTRSATLSFTGSFDNNRVAGYTARLLIDGVWTDVASNSVSTVYLRDLTPDTGYTAAVVAVDPNGNLSAQSEPVTFRTRAIEPAPTCDVSVLALGTQYSVDVTIENMTAATVLSNWSVTFTMPAAQQLRYSFNTTLTRSGDQAAAGPVWYNATVGPGGSVTFGFFATHPAGTPLPGGFTLNGGIACT